MLFTYLVGVDDLTYELDFITTRISINTNSYSYEGINSSLVGGLNTNYGSELFMGFLVFLVL